MTGVAAEGRRPTLFGPPPSPPSGARDGRHAAFAQRGSPEHRVDVSWLGGRIGLILLLGIAPCLAFGEGSTAQRVGGTVAVLAAAAATAVLARRTLPTEVLDVLLVAATVLIGAVGVLDGPIGPLVPVMYILLGTGVFVIRELRYSIVNLGLIGLSYAVVLAFGPDVEGVATRWVAVVSGVLISGLFVRWMVGHVIDVAQSERDARADAEQATVELHRLSAAKNDFLARMSHELRTPLNVILGFSDVLRDGLVGELSERQSSYVRDIAASGRDLLALVDELLDVTKVETGAIELALARTDLGRAVTDAEVLVRGRARQSGVSVELELPDAPLLADVDALRIRQVVWNLLGNAVKFTPRGGTVRVVLEARGDAAVVQVHDTGPGIAAEDQERIFGRFERATTEADGTGIGLALCRRFIEAHGGRLWMTSTPGVGSTFAFSVPRQADAAAAETGAARPVALTSAPSPYGARETLANRMFTARVVHFFANAAAALFLVTAAVTPGSLWYRAQIVGLAAASLLIAQVVQRFDARLPARTPEILGVLAALVVSAGVLLAEPYDDIAPLAYGWGVLAAAALLTRGRVALEVVGIAACYAVVLQIDAPPEPFERWVALLMLLAGNASVILWIADRLRQVVSEAIAARLAAEATRGQAEAVSAHKSDFLANTSHELCTPLNAIIGFAQVLDQQLAGPLTPTQADYVADILDSGEHLLDLITDLLDLAKLEAGHLPRRPRTVDIGALVTAVTAEVDRTASRRRIAVHTVLGTDLPEVIGDPRNLHQALADLVANAIKFTRDGGRVEVIGRCSADGTRVLVSIRDTGIGILPEQRSRLFEAFHQGSRPLPEHARGGTGLGLALARGLVELEGGTIGVESTPDVGSTFTVALVARRA